MGRLAHKYAVITGGAAGIGFAIARLFGLEGAEIAIVDCNRETLAQAKRKLESYGVMANIYCASVADENAVAEVFEALLKHWKKLDILVNNAGIADFSELEQTSMAAWNRVLNVNITGTFLCCKHALPLLKTDGGAIVNMASVAGLIGIRKMPAYCASKAAVIGLTRQMAADFSDLGIRVNCLCPGRVAGTELDQWIVSLDGEDKTRAKKAVYPMQRFGTPEEIAQAALFLASADASYISGAVLPIDGAITAI